MPNFTWITIVFLVVVVPTWLGLHYSSTWRRNRPFSADDEAMLSDLHKSADKMEQRLETIERILDDEMPGWRRSNNETL
jgi:phage shock protein B